MRLQLTPAILAIALASVFGPPASAVTFWEFNRSIDGIYIDDGVNPNPGSFDIYRQASSGGTFDATWDGNSSQTVTGTLGDYRSKQFGHFGREYGLTEGDQYAVDLIINPGNQATSFEIGLVEYNYNPPTATDPDTVVDDWGRIQFNLAGLAPGPHTVVGTFVPVAQPPGVNPATLANLRSIEAVRTRYYGSPTAALDVTLDRLKTVGHAVTFLEENFNAVGLASQTVTLGERNNFVIRSSTNSPDPFTPLGQIAPNIGSGNSKAIRLTADGSTLTAPAEGGTVWNAQVVAQLDFREGRIPFTKDNFQFNFDAKGTEAQKVKLQIRTFNDSFNQTTGFLEGEFTLAAANTLQSVSVSAKDFVVPVGQVAPDFAATRNIQFIWQMSSADWGLDAGNTLILDNIKLKAVDLAPTPTSGDFNNDGLVNAADYTVWRDNLGAPTEAPINNAGDGLFGVDPGDYAVWTGAFGPNAVAASSAVPEPFALASGLMGVSLLLIRRRTLAE
jgi:hypothetical protein